MGFERTHPPGQQQPRQDQQMENFQLQMHQRNTTEGTVDELVRRHSLVCRMQDGLPATRTAFG